MSLTSIDLSSSHCLYHVTFAIFRLNMLLEDYQTFSVFWKFSLPLLPENLSFTTSSINFLSSFKVELYLSKPNVKQNGTYCELSANRLCDMGGGGAILLHARTYYGTVLIKYAFFFFFFFFFWGGGGRKKRYFIKVYIYPLYLSYITYIPFIPYILWLSPPSPP